jgi:L-iditol 2-dehydrogenase/galactitol-1-phosphate 5-dehydrogenase
MKALSLLQNGELVYGEVDTPARPEGRYCLMRVAGAGICGSDIHRAFEHGAYHYPLIMGHEFSGIVEETPRNSLFRPGQRAAVFPLIPCMSCPACQGGDYAQCSDYDYLGSRRDGAFAEYVWVPEQNLFILPEHVDTLHAAMAEPCAVSLHGIRKLPLSGGERAVVFGGGSIGNMSAQWLRILGCGEVAMVDIDAQKLKIAGKMGFHTFDAADGDVVKAVVEWTGGAGADIVVEACGLPLTYGQAIESAARFSHILFLGTLNSTMSLTPQHVSAILRRELVLHGSWNSRMVPRGSDDWSTVLRFLDRELQVDPLISHRISLDEGPAFFSRMREGKKHVNKVLFALQ